MGTCSTIQAPRTEALAVLEAIHCHDHMNVEFIWEKTSHETR